MNKSQSSHNIFNINSNYSFLPSLVAWILQNYTDPFYLSNITILLPSRRACREIKKVFLGLAQNEAVILPKILAIGDVDYDEIMLDLDSSQNEIHYQLKLIDEIKNWNQKTNLFGKDISTAAIAEIADHLRVFLDEVAKEGLNLDDLIAVDDAELASHKQQILQFLRYFGSVWQNVLAKDGLRSKSHSRNVMLKNYNTHLQKNGSKYPIIAAGSTGSVLAAAELLKTIAGLKNGSVVLFGLDCGLDEKIWQKIAENHPQFMLKKLLERMGVLRGDIADIAIDGFKNADDFMVDLLSLSMLPAEFCDRWKSDVELIKNNKKIIKIETENEFDEARVIALMMRKTLEDSGKNAALISNDKNLIVSVKANLQQWQIEVDDSASSNLTDSNLANYLFLIAEFVNQDFSLVNLLATLKHPLCVMNKFLRQFEMEIARNVIKFSNFAGVLEYAKNNDPQLVVWIKNIADIFEPFLDEFKKENVDLNRVVELHYKCALSLSGTIENAEGCEEFLEFYDEISNNKIHFRLEPSSYNRVLKNLLKNYQFRKSGSFHPRLHILSTMEARLMSYDLTIVSGLCEGEFPSKSGDDWLGNKIRSDFGMPSLAKQIGISAYDFCNYLGNKELVLTYPKNKNNSPTIKSRFLLKLEAVLKVNGWENFLQNGDEYLQYLNRDQNQQIVTISRSNPNPVQNIQKISATDISKWIRNPYYIYAKRILHLKPLKRIEQEASFMEFGNFVHKVLENFVKDYQQIAAPERLDVLINVYGKKIFSDYFSDKTTHLLWWARFENISKWFVREEEILQQNLQKSFAEVEVEAIINDVVLSTKIDRLNLYLDGSFEIVDYKTGALPQTKEIKTGLEPQLAVEALILSRGTIKNYPALNGKISADKINNLQYQNLKGNDQNEVKNLVGVGELIDAAEHGISRLLEIFIDQNYGYICCPDFDIYKEDDYYHLTRIGEL